MFTVLWDNDGVLVDTEGLYFGATQAVLKTVGIDLTPEQCKEIPLRRGESTFQLALEGGISDMEIACLQAERDRLYVESLRAQPCVIDGVEESLRSLHGRVRMGVVTAYLGCSLVLWLTGRRPYRDNPFERQAFEQGGGQ